MTVQNKFEIQGSVLTKHGPWVLLEKITSQKLIPVVKKTIEWREQLGLRCIYLRVVRNGNEEEATYLKGWWE